MVQGDRDAVTPRAHEGEKKSAWEVPATATFCAGDGRYAVTPSQAGWVPTFFSSLTRARPVTDRRLILGPPGCGKTEGLLGYLDHELARVVPSEIAFVAFTRAAREEVLGRLGDRGPLPWLRTIHSAAYALLGLGPGQVLCDARWSEFARQHGYRFSDLRFDPDEGHPRLHGTAPDDRLVQVYEWGRNRRLGPRETLIQHPRAGVSPRQFELFQERLQVFLAEHRLFDFPGLLETVLAEQRRPPVRVAFIDEAQDLSPLQIAVVESWFTPCERVYVAGDDDQTVYSFQAADPTWIRGLAEVAHVEHLKRSRRVPRSVHSLALSVIRTNRDRVEKTYEPRDLVGEVVHLSRDHALELVDGKRKTFLLVRNRYLISGLAKKLMDRDLPFRVEGWGGRAPLSDPKLVKAIWLSKRLSEGYEGPIPAAPLRWMLRLVRSVPEEAQEAVKEARGSFRRAHLQQLGLGPFLDQLAEQGPLPPLTKLSKEDRRYLQALMDEYGELPEPQVTLTTIHGSKGREADLVLLFPDMSRATYRQYRESQEGQESETRVFYVGVTRALTTLVLVRPRTRRHFDFPRLAQVGGRP